MKKSFKGFMLINSFLKSDKFDEIYDYLKAAFEERQVELDVLKGTELILPDAQKQAAKEYDFCLFWDKDIALAKRLEQHGLILFNSAEAVENCDDKWLTYEALLPLDVKMPETVSVPFTYENIGYNSLEFVDRVAEYLGYPFVIKENKGSFGAQVYLAENKDTAVSILKNIQGRPAICQQFIETSRGHDIRINMVGKKAIACMERYSDSDFRANITAGGHMKKHEPTEAEIALAIKAMEGLKLDFAGVDILKSDSGPMLCEVNSNAHFKNIYDLTGVNVAEAIADYIIEACKARMCSSGME